MQFLYFVRFIFSSRSGSQRLKKRVGVFLNSIAFKRNRTFLKLREKHAEWTHRNGFQGKIFRIIEFPGKFMLILIFLASDKR